MDEIKKLTKDQFRDIASRLAFNGFLITKDYYITIILFLIRNINGLYFKGGTALQKILLNYSRISEDIDFTVAGDLGEVKNRIIEIIENSKLFEKVTKDKDVDGFIRLVVHYKGFSNESGEVFIDLNKRAKLFLKPENHKINHFYQGSIPNFSFNTLAKEELIAEKVCAAIKRNKPRDHYDIYKIIKAGIPINLSLVKRKCERSEIAFNIIKIFNRANKLKNRWDKDLLPLLAEEVTFQEVMGTLANYFKLKEEKEKQRQLKKAN